MRFFRLVSVLILALFLGFTGQEARAQAGVTTLSCTPPATDPELAALARALNYDPLLIYEYIYYDIDFAPTFGSKKGALGTYLDRRGNNFDQNVLFVTLLRQSSPTSSATGASRPAWWRRQGVARRQEVSRRRPCRYPWCGRNSR